MNKKILQSIIKDKKICYFISPHFDDAVLSAGGVMSYLSAHVSVVVINIFTEAESRPYTLSARQYLQQCGYDDAKKLFADRKREDSNVLKTIGATVINLGFVDSLWRKKKDQTFLSRLFPTVAELRTVYPTYRFHILRGNVASEDTETLSQIQKQLSAIVKSDNTVIFCPLAVGNHIDHVITRKACEVQFPSVVYWSDFPYNGKAQDKNNTRELFSFAENLYNKKKLIEGYKTQYQAMFYDGLQLTAEKFFVKEGTYEK